MAVCEQLYHVEIGYRLYLIIGLEIHMPYEPMLLCLRPSKRNSLSVCLLSNFIAAERLARLPSPAFASIVGEVV
jgi:hypothetical protein